MIENNPSGPSVLMIPPYPRPRRLLGYVGRGMLDGVKCGVLASEVYIIGFALIAFFGYGEFDALPIIVLLGQIYGAIPAMCIGVTAGALFGLIYFLGLSRASPFIGAFTGGILASGLLALLEFLPNFTFFDDWISLLLFSPILVLFIISGAWTGYDLTGGKIHTPSMWAQGIRYILLFLVIFMLLAFVSKWIVGIVFKDHTSSAHLMPVESHGMQTGRKITILSVEMPDMLIRSSWKW